MKYSIIKGQLCMETQEHLSVGLVAFCDDKVYYNYSDKKMAALKLIYSPKQYDVFRKMVVNFGKENISESILSYLHRYSNNLLTVSELTEIDMPATEKSANMLFKRYVETN